MASPWTHEELAEMRLRLEKRMNETEAEYPNIRPLPPMTLDEAENLLSGLADTATVRVLTADEAFLHGQLLAAYGMAMRASMLGRKGRFYVISEEDMSRLAK